MIRPMDVTPEMIEARQALAFVRSSDDRYNQWSPLGNAIRILEETGVFAEIDEVIDSDKIPELLAEGAAIDFVNATTPAPGAIKPHEALQVLRNTWRRWPKGKRPL